MNDNNTSNSFGVFPDPLLTHTHTHVRSGPSHSSGSRHYRKSCVTSIQPPRPTNPVSDTSRSPRPFRVASQIGEQLRHSDTRSTACQSVAGGAVVNFLLGTKTLLGSGHHITQSLIHSSLIQELTYSCSSLTPQLTHSATYSFSSSLIQQPTHSGLHSFRLSIPSSTPPIICIIRHYAPPLSHRPTNQERDALLSPTLFPSSQSCLVTLSPCTLNSPLQFSSQSRHAPQTVNRHSKVSGSRA